MLVLDRALKNDESTLDRIAVLAEPSRRALYRFVAGSPTEISRDEAARATGLSRVLAAFHLDRLVTAGLLQASYRRISGRTGPGAGRPAKLYHRTRQPIAINLPERRYAMLARLFATAIERAPQHSTRATLSQAAQELGRDLAEDRRRVSGKAPRRAIGSMLDELGYEPYWEGTTIRLRNCPFQPLSEEHRELVCNANLSLMQGLLEGISAGDFTAELDPIPDRCCVAFRSRA